MRFEDCLREDLVEAYENVDLQQACFDFIKYTRRIGHALKQGQSPERLKDVGIAAALEAEKVMKLVPFDEVTIPKDDGEPETCTSPSDIALFTSCHLKELQLVDFGSFELLLE